MAQSPVDVYSFGMTADIGRKCPKESVVLGTIVMNEKGKKDEFVSFLGKWQ